MCEDLLDELSEEEFLEMMFILEDEGVEEDEEQMNLTTVVDVLD